MAKIKTLKDYNNETIYPQSTTKAIVDANGINLDTLHSKFVMMDQITEIEDIGSEYENTLNKVTTIDNTVTDVQYPSAKAVYDFGMAIKNVGIKIEVVNALPNTGDSKIIYLINNGSSEEQNIYDEYVYVNNTWEHIGTTKVDLSNYATKEYVDNKNVSFTVTIPTTGWTETSPYSLEIAIEGILATDNPIVGLINIESSEQKEAWNCISKIITEDNKIIVYADDQIPSVEINILLQCMR